MSTQTLQLLSQSHWLADGSQTVWNFSFTGGYINPTHVRAYKKSPSDVRTELTIDYDTDLIGPFQLLISPAVEAGYTLVIYRDSSNGGLPLVDFADGAALDEKSLDVVAKQSVFVSAETEDFLGVTTEADLVALGVAAAAAAGAAAASAANADLSADLAAADRAFAEAASNSAGVYATNAFNSAANAAAAATSAVAAYNTRLTSKVSASDGSGIPGFKGNLNYLAETIGWAVTGLAVDPRWFATNGVFGTGVVDDTVALQAAWNWIPAAGCGTVVVPRNSDIRCSAQIQFVNRRATVEFNNSRLTLIANAASLLYVSGENIVIRDVALQKAVGVTGEGLQAVTCSDLVLEHVQSWDQKWTKVFHLTEVRDSLFENCTVKNNIASASGNTWELDYCVNNLWVGGSYMYADQAFYCSSVTHPTFGYSCEGVTLLGVRTYGNHKSVTADRVTSLSILGCNFDFNLTWGVFATNGQDMTVGQGTWIAADTANGFIGVGTGATFANAKVLDATIHRGATAITGSVGVSLPGPRAKVAGVAFEGGMNGGTVTDATSRVYGYSVASPGTDLTTPNGNLGVATIAKTLPSFSLTFGGVAASINILASSYTESGTEILARIRCQLNALGAGTGVAELNGLPKANNGTFFGSCLIVKQTNMAANLSVVGQVPTGASKVLLFLDSNPTTQATHTAFTATSEIDVEIRYQYA